MSDFIDPDEQKKAREREAKERNRSILQGMGKHPITKYLKKAKRKLERTLLSTYEEYMNNDEKVVDLAAVRDAKAKSNKDRK